MTIDLQPFCGEPEACWRHAIGEPWIADGWKYATDLRMLVRLPAGPGRKPDNVPDAASLFSDFDPELCKDQLPIWDGSLYEYQEDCDYPQCHGGKISGGKRSCNVCQGKGWTPETMATTVEFQGFNFDGNLVQIVHGLPGVKGYVKPLTVGRDAHGQLQFIFGDGGQGMLMNKTSTITTKGIDQCGK